MNWKFVHRVWALGWCPRKPSLGAQTLCMALLLLASTTNPARADCPAAPISDPDDMAISFLAANGVQAASASLLASTVEEGTLVYDDTADKLKVCDGANWIEVGSGSSTDTLASLSCSAGQIAKFNGTAWACAADDGNAGGATNAPAFRVYRSAAYTSASGNFKFDYDAEAYDTTNSYDLSSDQFVAPLGGKYLFTAIVAPGVVGTVAPWLQVNGTSVAWGNFESTNSGNHRILSSVVALNAGDIVQLWISNNSGVTSWNVGQNYSAFTGTMLNFGSGADTLAALSCSSGQIAKWNGTAWACAADGGGAAGSVQSATQATSPMAMADGVYTDTATLTVNTSGTYVVMARGYTVAVMPWLYFSSNCYLYVNGAPVHTSPFYYGAHDASTGSSAFFPHVLYHVGSLTAGQTVKTTCLSTSSSSTRQAYDWRIDLVPVGGGGSSGGAGSAAPAFRVHRNAANQTVTNGSAATIDWTTEDFDTASNFDPATDRFTPTVAGKYLVTAATYCPNATAYCLLHIYKNGTLSVGEGFQSDNDSAPAVTALVDMNGTTDYLTVVAVNNGGTTLSGASHLTYFSGFLTGSTGGEDTLADLSCSSGQIPKWNGTAWACAADGGSPTQVAFNVRKTANQPVASGSWQKVAWEAEEFDTNNNFDLSTERFTPTIPGKYQLNLTVYSQDVNGWLHPAIYKNGAYYGGNVGSGNNANRGTTVSMVVDMNGSTDYIEAYAYLYGTGTVNIYGASQNWTHFSGFLIGGGGSDTLAGLSCSSGQIPKWNGTAWACAADDGGSSGTLVTGTGGASSSAAAAVTNAGLQNFPNSPTISLPSAGTYLITSDAYYVYGSGCGDIYLTWSGSNVTYKTNDPKWQACGTSGTSEWATYSQIVVVSAATTLNAQYLWTNAGTTGQVMFGGSKFIKLNGGGGGSGNSVEGPSFSAYRSGNQTVATNTPVKIVFNTEEFDSNNNFDTATGRFTPTVAGTYLLTANAYCPDSNTWCQVRIYRNGSEVVESGSHGSVDLPTTTALVAMNGTTDYVEAYVYNGGGTTVGGAAQWTRFSGFKIGGGSSQWTDVTGGINYAGGKVGIGTATPGEILDVVDAIRPLIRVMGPSTVNKNVYLTDSTNDRQWAISQDTSNKFGISYYDGTAWLSPSSFTIDTSGKVGIGTTAPGEKLHVAGQVRIAPGAGNFATTFTGNVASAIAVTGSIGNNEFARLTFGNGLQANYAGVGTKVTSGGSYLYLGTSNNYANGITNEAVVIDPVGNVGIGTATPKTQLQLGAASGLLEVGSAPARTMLANNAYWDGSAWKRLTANNGAPLLQLNTDNTTYFYRATDAGNTADSTITYTASMMIGADGRVGIGTGAPSARLAVVRGTDTWTADFFGLSTSNSVRIGTLGGVATIGANNNAGNAWADLSINPGGNTLFATTTGNVGIGTTSPQGVLDISAGRVYLGATKISPGPVNSIGIDSATGSSGWFEVGNSNSRKLGIGFYSTDSAADPCNADAAGAGTGCAVVGTYGSNDALWLGGSKVVFGAGKVGIGTTSPGAPLSIVSTTNGTRINAWMDMNSSVCGIAGVGQNVYLNQADNSYKWANTHANIGGSLIQLGVCGAGLQNDILFLRATGTSGSISTTANAAAAMTESMRITGSGNVGIGTASPAKQLHIVGPGSGAIAGFRLEDPNTTAGGFAQITLRDRGPASDDDEIWDMRVGDDGKLVFGTLNNAETAFPSLVTFLRNGNVGIGTGNPTEKLYVTGNIVAQNQLYDLTSNPQGGAQLCRNGTTGVHSACSSDRRLKKNIVTIDETVLPKVLDLRPVQFDWINDPVAGREAGFIAQEVRELFPLTVKGDEAKEKLTFAPGNLVPYLVKAMQELKADNDNLRAELKAANDNDAAQNAALDELRKEIEALKAAH